MLSIRARGEQSGPQTRGTLSPATSSPRHSARSAAGEGDRNNSAFAGVLGGDQVIHRDRQAGPVTTHARVPGATSWRAVTMKPRQWTLVVSLGPLKLGAGSRESKHGTDTGWSRDLRNGGLAAPIASVGQARIGGCDLRDGSDLREWLSE